MPTAPTATPAPCWACHRTAQLGTPAEAAAVEPHLCPRCDHAYALSLTGGDAATHPFRGEDSPTWTAPSPEPSPAADVAELAEVPVAWLPWESGYEPELELAELPAAEGPGLARCAPDVAVELRPEHPMMARAAAAAARHSVRTCAACERQVAAVDGVLTRHATEMGGWELCPCTTPAASLEVA